LTNQPPLAEDESIALRKANDRKFFLAGKNGNPTLGSSNPTALSTIFYVSNNTLDFGVEKLHETEMNIYS